MENNPTAYASGNTNRNFCKTNLPKEFDRMTILCIDCSLIHLEKLQKDWQNYLQQHPITQTNSNSNTNVSDTKPSRIDYRKIDGVEYFGKAAFTDDYVSGEKYYWEGGLRDRLLAEDKQNLYVATDGINVSGSDLFIHVFFYQVELSKTLYGIYDVLNFKYPKKSLYITRIGGEGLPLVWIPDLDL